MKKLAISVAAAAALIATIAGAPAQARGLGLASGVIAGAIAAGIAADVYASEPGYGYYGPRTYRHVQYDGGYYDEPGYRTYRRHRGWRHGWGRGGRGARRSRRARCRWIRPDDPCRPLTFPIAQGKREACMAKIDLDTLSIEELAALRDQAADKLAEKVAARQAELEAELEKLAQYGKPAKKSQATPVAKPKKDDAAKESIARAA